MKEGVENFNEKITAIP